jgi:hypothetical protein
VKFFFSLFFFYLFGGYEILVYKLGLDTLLFGMLIFWCAWVVLVMFLKLKEFGGISFLPEESVSLSIVRVGPYLGLKFGLYTAVYWLSF